MLDRRNDDWMWKCGNIGMEQLVLVIFIHLYQCKCNGWQFNPEYIGGDYDTHDDGTMVMVYMYFTWISETDGSLTLNTSVIASGRWW